MKAHWLDTQTSIDAQTLEKEGVYYRELPTTESQYGVALEAFKQEKGYIEQDIVELSPSTPGLDSICAKFIDEHLHDDDEVRFVLGGEGVFDIRSSGDRWMRVEVSRGDLISVPEGRYHRFMLTDSRNICCVRLFKDKSGWVPHYRA